MVLLCLWLMFITRLGVKFRRWFLGVKVRVRLLRVSLGFVCVAITLFVCLRFAPNLVEACRVGQGRTLFDLNPMHP